MDLVETNGARPLSRGILVVTVTGLVAVLMVLMLMLANGLYRHDIQIAERNAEHISKLLTTAILSTMMKTGDKNHVRSLMAELKTKQPFTFRIYRGPNVERQYGVVDDERPNDDASRRVFDLRKPLMVYPNDTTLRYLTPLITDNRCAQCHQDLSGNPVPPEVVQGAYEVVFDLKEVKAGSIRTIVQVMLLTIGGLAVFAFLIYRLIVSNILDPIRQMHYTVSGWLVGDYDRALPEPHSAELRSLSDLLRRIASQRKEPGT